jgi:hypothetical protein
MKTLFHGAIAPWLFILALVVSGPCLAQAAEFDLILDARPGTLLISEGADLRVLGPDQFDPAQVTIIEEAGTLNTFPNIRLGAGFDTRDWYIDASGLLGVLVNSRYNGVLYGADVAAQYKYRKNVNVGPHLSLMMLPAPEWSGDGEVEFSDSTAWVLGAQCSIGYDVLFVFSVDYMLADPFDVESGDPGVWLLDEDEVDISGLAVQFGVRGRF